MFLSKVNLARLKIKQNTKTLSAIFFDAFDAPPT